MISDLQGIGDWLIDPEIASTQESQESQQESQEEKENERLFTAGNLLGEAIELFATEHECNQFCVALGLEKLLKKEKEKEEKKDLVKT